MIAASFIFGILGIVFWVLYACIPSLNPEGGGWNSAKTIIGFLTLVLLLSCAACVYFR